MALIVLLQLDKIWEIGVSTALQHIDKESKERQLASDICCPDSSHLGLRQVIQCGYITRL